MTVLAELPALPTAAKLYARAALTARRKPSAKASLPQHGLRLKTLRFDPAHVEDYNKICGLPAGELAITYPQVVASGLHIEALLHPEYPYPLMGMVHLKNHITQHAPLSVGVDYSVEVEIGPAVATHLGLEVDLLTRYLQNDELVWEATTTVLHRQKVRSQRPPQPAPPLAVTAQYQPFSVAEDTGRRYAPISGDYNPIHQYAVTAKAFGFKRAIAHGMWSLARSLGLILATHGGSPKTLDVQFKQPLFLPSSVTLKTFDVSNGVGFELLAQSGGRAHFSGQVLF